MSATPLPKRHNCPVLRFVAVLAAVFGIGATIAPATPAVNHGWDVRCGADLRAGYGWFGSKGFNVNCPTVRFVADHYTFEEPGDHHFAGWHCDEDRIAEEIWRVDCKNRRGTLEHIRFKYGA
jgi:hypothetical protein